MRRLILATLLVCTASTAALAEAYVGAAAGKARLEQTELGTRFEADDTCLKGYGGFRFVKFFGVEVSYNDLGTQDDTAGGLDFKADVKAWNAFAVGVVPIGKFEMFAKVGFSHWTVDATVSAPLLPVTHNRETGDDKVYGVGVAFKFISLLAIRAEYEKYDVGGGRDLEMATVGLDIRF